VKGRMIERGVVSEDQLSVIYKSQTFPTTGYGVVYNLTPELQEKIREAFFSFEWEGSALAEEFGKNGEDQFIEITFKDDWSVIRTIDEANGVTYDCQ
jgi:phosphonate transport system substrate-binding protein